MTPLETVLDPLAFNSWVQVTALLIIVVGGISWKWLGTMKARQQETGEVVDEIKKTLTTNNGGSHIKDQLDRIEKIQEQQAALMAADSQKLVDHVDWSTQYVRETSQRLDGLSCQQRVGHRFFAEEKQNETIG